MSTLSHFKVDIFPSDIQGLIWIPFEKSIADAKNTLASSLQKAGFPIDIDALSAE